MDIDGRGDKDCGGDIMTEKKPPQFYRQRFLLALLYVFGKKLSKTDFQKYLFLYQQEYQNDNQIYYFLPYRYGPFSFQSYADLRRLEDLEFIHNKEFIELKDDYNYCNYLKENDKILILKFLNNYKNIQGKDLIKYVYTKYPYFASKSLIVEEILGKDSNLINNHYSDNESFFTIGYEGKTIDQYLNDIILNNINLVIDVRKNPISMKYGFSKKTLSNSLKQLNIEYVHIPELGIESNERQNLFSFYDYQKLFEHYENDILAHQNTAILKITELYNTKKRIALTCFEKDYNSCHRSRISNIINKKFGIKINNL